MNKFIVFISLSLTIFALAGCYPGGPKDGENKGPRKGKRFTPCALEKCATESQNLKNLAQGGKVSDECLKKCNPEGKKYKDLDRSEVKKIEDCLVENKCKDKKQRFNHKNSTEFQAFKKCVDEKCPDDYKRSFKPTELPTTVSS